MDGQIEDQINEQKIFIETSRQCERFVAAVIKRSPLSPTDATLAILAGVLKTMTTQVGLRDVATQLERTIEVLRTIQDTGNSKSI